MLDKVEKRGIYKHAGNKKAYFVFDFVEIKDDETGAWSEGVMYLRQVRDPETVPIFYVRTIENFKKRFTK